MQHFGDEQMNSDEEFSSSSEGSKTNEINFENSVPGKEKADQFTWKSFFMETLQTILLAVILYFIIDTAFARVRVDNISMIPTLKPGEFLLVNKLSYRFGDLQRGDIIVFHAPVNPSEDYIKRTIGLPGETIRVEDGQVYVNDVAISEPYLKKAIAYEGSWEVPEDTVFVLGDNRNQSSDSHSWGFVPQENVVGKALVIYWPFNEVTVLKVADAY